MQSASHYYYLLCLLLNNLLYVSHFYKWGNWCTERLRVARQERRRPGLGPPNGTAWGEPLPPQAPSWTPQQTLQLGPLEPVSFTLFSLSWAHRLEWVTAVASFWSAQSFAMSDYLKPWWALMDQRLCRVHQVCRGKEHMGHMPKLGMLVVRGIYFLGNMVLWCFNFA